MDQLTASAARALAAADPLGALNLIALRDDPTALALRGIAMAQLGDLDRARALLKRAARRFGRTAPLARARCLLAEAEIALVSRELGRVGHDLASAREILEREGDPVNAAHASYLEARLHLLIGQVDAAAHRHALVDAALLSPALLAGYELVSAGISLRRLRAADARKALARADAASRRAGVASVAAEVAAMRRTLDTPAARLMDQENTRPLLLDEVEALLASDTLVIDACRHVVRMRGRLVPLGTRPVLFSLVAALAEAWPNDVTRATLLRRAFGARQADESHRARLRVEIGRLRQLIAREAEVVATEQGFLLVPRAARAVVLAPTVDDRHADVLALLADGEAWSSTALALALAVSQRAVQRALQDLAARGLVQAMGDGPSRRWLAPSMPGFPTELLLPLQVEDE